MLLLLEEEADRTTTKFRKAKSRDRREAENNEKWGCNPPPIFGKNGISGHVACCMVVNRVLSHSSHFPSRTYLFPIIILSIRTVSAGILESVWSQLSQHTCTNVTSPSPGILQLFRFHLSECLVACWEIEPWGYFMVRAFVEKAIQSRGPRPNNMNAGLRIRSRRRRSTSAAATAVIKIEWNCS